ncbi:MAG: S9 family peptidase [Xanthomonadales bacterium]|nr:hypothetical protein [Xanthomonadales bacterium]MCC6594570.1 S9 family peptidase [Xanthomonadales bacterium]
MIRKALVALTLFALLGCAQSPKLSSASMQVQAAAAKTGATLVEDGLPARSEPVAQQWRPYQNMRPALLQGWLPKDAGVLISVRFGDVPQLAKVTQGEGMRTQLTFFDDAILQAWVSPNPEVNGAIFSMDSGGDEYFQLYFLDFARGSSHRLTDGRARNERVVFAADGRHYAYASTRRNGRDFDVWIGELGRSGGHRLALERSGAWYPLDFSADGKRLLVQEYYSIAHSRLHLLDLESGQLTRIRVGKEDSADRYARFDGEGHVLVLTDALGEFSTVARVELTTGIVAPLFAPQAWDVEEIDLSADRRYLAVLRNVEGSSELKVYDREDRMQEVRSVALDQGVIPRMLFNHAGSEVAFGISGPQTPGDVFSRTLNSGVMTRWTRGETGGIDPNLFVAPELIHYGAHDTDPNMLNLPRQIPAHVYRPQTPGPYPALILIHGGPESQARPQFSELIQFLVRERGIAVVVPNVRGSSGYGKTYLALDDGRKRQDSVTDIGALIAYLRVQPDFDQDRIAVYGGSYGGFMVLASMVQFGEQLRAGVDVVGISNFVSFLTNTNPYRAEQRRREYGDERDPQMRAFLHEISPLTHAAKIDKPLFVVQGANDPRVPRSEAEQIVHAVRANGQSAWYLLALDEGHGFRKKGNRDRLGEVVVQFLDEHLLPAPPAQP